MKDYIDDQSLHQWQPANSLHLYHGKRLCASRAFQLADLCFVDLFTADDDASLGRHSKLEFVNSEGVEQMLRCRMDSLGMPECPVRKIRAVSDDNSQDSGDSEMEQD